MNDYIANVEKNFLNVTRDRNAGEFQYVKNVIQNVTERLIMLQKADGRISGVKTGYYDLDRLTSGFQPLQHHFARLTSFPSFYQELKVFYSGYTRQQKESFLHLPDRLRIRQGIF